MKNSFFLLQFLVFTTTISFSQRISIANESQNIVYVGIDNPLTIAVENFPGKSIVAKTDNGELFGSVFKYTLRPKKVGPAVITIYKKSNGKLKEMGKSYFRAKAIWDPVFYIGSGKDSISRKELQAQQYVMAILEGSDMDLRFMVESFLTCVVSKDTCKYVEVFNKGNAIGKDLSEMFQKLKPYDTIIFKEIICVGPEGKRKIEPRIITVVE